MTHRAFVPLCFLTLVVSSLTLISCEDDGLPPLGSDDPTKSLGSRQIACVTDWDPDVNAIGGMCTEVYGHTDYPFEAFCVGQRVEPEGCKPDTFEGFGGVCRIDGEVSDGWISLLFYMHHSRSVEEAEEDCEDLFDPTDLPDATRTRVTFFPPWE